MKRKSILSRILQSFLIWIATNVLASAIVGTTLTDEFLLILAISLVASSPCLILLPFVLYAVDKMNGQTSRIGASIVAILLICLLVIVIFSVTIGGSLLSDPDVRLALSCYVSFAFISFFSVHEFFSHYSIRQQSTLRNKKF